MSRIETGSGRCVDSDPAQRLRRPLQDGLSRVETGASDAGSSDLPSASRALVALGAGA